jgi:hypothetical protein
MVLGGSERGKALGGSWGDERTYVTVCCTCTYLDGGRGWKYPFFFLALFILTFHYRYFSMAARAAVV